MIIDYLRYFPQTQQGADIIASSLKTTVYMPDFFEPDGPFPSEKYPPKTDQDKADLQDFFAGIASPPIAIKKLTSFGEFLKSKGAKKVAIYGFCWGEGLHLTVSRLRAEMLMHRWESCSLLWMRKHAICCCSHCSSCVAMVPP